MEKMPKDKDEKRREDEPHKKIDGNAIVSPQNTRRLYGRKPLDIDEPKVEGGEDVPIPLPDDTDENMFPSAP
jgi:hypothetical protein